MYQEQPQKAQIFNSYHTNSNMSSIMIKQQQSQVRNNLELDNRYQVMIKFDQKSMNEINTTFLQVCKQVQGEYLHDERGYQRAHQILQYIQTNSSPLFTEEEQVMIINGKTGWGKSTITNILDGVQFKINEDGQIYPKDQTKLKTAIGNGKGSTTLFPVYAKTRFGKICDLPGDDETRGIVAQIINSISKKNIGKILKKIKLMMVVPASTFTSSGSYGSDFKKLLASTDKFLGNLNKYSQNIILIVNFSQKFPKSLEKTKQTIRNLLEHEDGLLEQYRQLINSILADNRIKLIAKPSFDSQDFVPIAKVWKQQSIEKIVEMIKNIPSKQCKEQDFSVPYNPNIIHQLKLFFKIFIQKAKNILQSSVTKLQVSGIQLKFVKNLLRQILNSKNTTLRQIKQKFKTNGYFNISQIDEVQKQINFIYQFIQVKQNKHELFKDDWISPKLVQKFNNILDQIQQAKSVNILNFRKRLRFQSLLVQPNSKYFDRIQQLIKELQQLQFQYEHASRQTKDQTSLFYDDKMLKVFDKTVEQAYEIDEKYYQQQIQPKLQKVQKQKQEQVDVTKQRFTIKQQQEKYVQQIQKIRKVPKTQTIVQQYLGQRKYILFGPRQKETKRITRNIQIDQIYIEQVEKTRKRQAPHIQNYTIKQKRVRLVEQQQWKDEKVQVQKMRKRIQYRQKTEFKDYKIREFNREKYEEFINKVAQQIQLKQMQVKQIIEDRLQQKVRLQYTPEVIEEYCKCDIERDYLYLFSIWHDLEHEALALKFPQRKINNGKGIVIAD